MKLSEFLIEYQWHDSKYPKAHGKFKELSAKALADWLIETRKGNAKAIYGAINQQITFHKSDEEYVKKMERVRKIIKSRLSEDKKFPPKNFLKIKK